MKISSKNPIISIIIPVYNMEDYVEQSVMSVVNQTFKNVEIIVVDDGSTDSSLQIIEKLARKHKRIKVISKENSGLASAYNAGQHMAKGKYIYFLDSDDWLEPDCLGIMYNVAEKTQAEVIKSFGFIVERNGYALDQIMIPPQKCDRLITNMLEIPEFVSKHVAQWTCLYRRDFILNNNIWCPEFPKNMSPDSDYMYHVWCKCKKLFVIKKMFVHYRTDNDNSVKNSGSAMSFRLMRGHMAARATMVKLFMPNPYWYVKTRIEFEHFLYELITYRCSTNRWGYIKAISKIFKENIRHGLVNLKPYTFKHRMTYKIIAWFPWVYWLNSTLKIYTETLNRRTGGITLNVLGGIYKRRDEKDTRKIFLFGHLIKKYIKVRREDYVSAK